MNSNGYLGMALRDTVVAGRGAGGAHVRRRSAGGAVHQRHLRPARQPRTAAGALSRPRGGHDLQLGVCSGHGRTAVARHWRDCRDQRRAQPQLHHQRGASGPAQKEAGVPRISTSPSSSSASLPPPARATGSSSSPTASSACAATTPPLSEIQALIAAHDDVWAENAVTVMDDSHGVGAFGATGRGTEEVTGGRADVLVATLGKALGVNGGYVVGSQVLIDLPARDLAVLRLLEPDHAPPRRPLPKPRWNCSTARPGCAQLAHLRAMTDRCAPGSSAWVSRPSRVSILSCPLLTRDTDLTQRLVPPHA